MTLRHTYKSLSEFQELLILDPTATAALSQTLRSTSTCNTHPARAREGREVWWVPWVAQVWYDGSGRDFRFLEVQGDVGRRRQEREDGTRTLGLRNTASVERHLQMDYMIQCSRDSYSHLCPNQRNYWRIKHFQKHTAVGSRCECDVLLKSALLHN